MALKETLLALMLSMPAPYDSEESPKARASRLDTIATAITEATTPQDGWLPSWSHQDRALLALVVTYHESGRWRLDVHNGTRRGDHGRSVCLGQIMSGPWLDRKVWESLPGTSLKATRACLTQVVSYLARARRMCASGLGPTSYAAARTFTLYGTGHQCKAIKLGNERGRHFSRLRYDISH